MYNRITVVSWNTHPLFAHYFEASWEGVFAPTFVHKLPSFLAMLHSWSMTAVTLWKNGQQLCWMCTMEISGSTKPHGTEAMPVMTGWPRISACTVNNETLAVTSKQGYTGNFVCTCIWTHLTRELNQKLMPRRRSQRGICTREIYNLCKKLGVKREERALAERGLIFRSLRYYHNTKLAEKLIPLRKVP